METAAAVTHREDRRRKVFCSYTNMVPISEIKENPKNANTHDVEQIEILANAIMATGWRTPIGVSKRSGFIVRGHGRFAAAKALGLTEVPVDFQDYETDAQEYADLLADNKIADLSEIDYQGVSDVLRLIPTDQLALTGFREWESTPLLAVDWTPPPLCEVPQFIASVKFATTEAEGEIVRRAIKIVQSKSKQTLSDGQCLEIIVNKFLESVINDEKKPSTTINIVIPQETTTQQEIPQ